MSPQRRRTVGLTIGIVLAVASAVFSAFALWSWHQRGWGALAAIPAMGKKNSPPPPGMNKKYQPQSIVIMYPYGPAERAGLRLGDKIIAIGGVDFQDNEKLKAFDRTVGAGDTVVYSVERDGKRLDVPVRFDSPMRHPFAIAQALVFFLVGVVFIVIGALIFSRRSEDRRVFIFYILTLAAGVSFLGMAGAATSSGGMRGIAGESGETVIFLMIFLIIGLLFIPLTLHLALIFPRERPMLQRMPQVFRWIYGLPILTGIAAAVFTPLAMWLAAMKRGSHTELAKYLGLGTAIAALLVTAVLLFRALRPGGLRGLKGRPLTIFAITLLFPTALALLFGAAGYRLAAFIALGVTIVLPSTALLCMPILSCVALYRSYREANVEERRQVAWPLWGMIIAIGVRLTVSVVGGVGGAVVTAMGGDLMKLMLVSQPAEILSRGLYVLIPISFAAAILKYRLMNIDIIIRKTVVYTILSGAIVFLYLVLVGGFGTLLVNLTGLRNQTMVITSTLIVALLFVPLRNKLQTLVDRNLFRHKYDYPEALRAIAAETLNANDLPAFLGSSAEKLQQALQNRAVMIFVPRHDELVAAAKVGVADSLLGTLRFPSRGFVELLDRPFDPRRRALPDSAAAALKRIEAVLVVPINTPGTPANGFIALGAKLSDAEFNVEDIDFLRSIADQVDLGIDRIRMQRDDADYAQARAIQQTLLPREMPRVAGVDVSGMWQPARTVGGDYYDLLELGPNELAVCIGDVAGKGMPAALLMSGLQAAVRASAGESRSPREVVERVRRVVVTSLSGGRFVTFFFATIDTAAMRIRWCNAGHNAPILVRADGTVERLAAGGAALSRLFRDQPFTEGSLPIQSGDRILLFTDGASEARDAAGDLLGEQRLEEIAAAHRQLPAAELQQKIVDAALQFSKGELDDDLTLVVVAVA